MENGTGDVDLNWPGERLSELFCGAVVVARDAEAEPVRLPKQVPGCAEGRDVTWPEFSSGTFVGDRAEVVGAWWDAANTPGVAASTQIRRQEDGIWTRQDFVVLNLLDDPDWAVMLVGFRILEEIDEPAIAAEADSVRPRIDRPQWVLQELTRVGVVTRTDGDVEEIFGRNAEELLDKPVLTFIHPDDTNVALQAWGMVLEEPGGLRTVEQRVVRPDGSVRWIETSIINRLEVSGGGSVTTLSHDITERRAADRRLHERATTDELTGVLNRSAIFEALQKQIRSGPVLVAFVDLDGFKAVNDSYGHEGGDRVLRAIASRLQTMVRPEASVGRWGGDEFIVIDPVSSDTDLRRAVDGVFVETIDVGGDTWCPAGSVGVAQGSVGDDATDLIRWADRAMYRAKFARRRQGSAQSGG